MTDMTETAKGPNATKEDKNPRGGLSAKGHAKFGTQKGVTNYGSASRKDKGRWVSWALRFTGSPKPVKDDKGRPTRYALMFRAWGEAVPTSREAVAAVHQKALKRSKELKNADKASFTDSADDFDGAANLHCAEEDCARSFARFETLLTHLEDVHLELAEIEEQDSEDDEAADNVPTNAALYAKVKAEAKKKFEVYPSAYANAWIVQQYKKRGGGYKKAKDAAELEDFEWQVAAQDLVEESQVDDSAAEGGLTKWFKEQWVDLSRPKKGGGFEACGRPTEGMSASDYRKAYPKCVPASKARSMSPAARKSAISRKRAGGLPKGGKPNPVKTDASEEAKEFTPFQRKAAAGKGQAQKDGSFPIKTEQDLKNAIQAFGRAKNKAATKAFIIRRAKALKLTNLIPKGWTVSSDSASLGAITCPDEDCQRTFMSEVAMLDHAEAVHTFDDIRRLLQEYVREEFGRQSDYRANPVVPGIYTWIEDLSADWVVFQVEDGNELTLKKASYSITDSKVTLGTPVEVKRRTVYDVVGSSSDED